MKFRDEKIVSIIERLAADFLANETGKTSMITVTRAVFQEKENSATIFISVFPSEKEGVALEFARRKRSDLREYVRDHVKMRAVPIFEFEIDPGEKNRQLIDNLARRGK